MKKIIIASDSFKGCLSSIEVANAVEQGIKFIMPECNIIKIDVADGGEGTATTLTNQLKGSFIKTTATNPLGESIICKYGMISETQTAIIDIASICGLTLIPQQRRNPLFTTTFGVGELILDAIKRGCRKFIIGLGGSATNDGGAGMLQALGYKFLDSNCQEIKTKLCGKDLERICSIDDSNVKVLIRDCSFKIACDVENPFYGEQGATLIFGPQKGANQNAIEELEQGMKHYVNIIESAYHISLQKIAGSGAAGGLGGAFYAFLNSKLVKGIELVLDTIHFDKLLTDTDLVITGEGSIDEQTAKGKTAYGVLQHCKAHNVPAIAIGGKVKLSSTIKEMGFKSIYEISDSKLPLEISMQKEIATKNIIDTIRINLPKLLV